MKTLLAALGLAACLALAGCFTSEGPLFEGAGVPVMGAGRVSITTHENGQDPDTGEMEWTAAGYVEPDKPDNDGVMTFHHMPGGGPFSPWYIGQTNGSGGNDGYMYLLYRKQGARLYSYDISCEDLTDAEAAAAHLVRKDGGRECVATRASDLGQAFRLLAKRKSPKNYMVATPAKTAVH